MLKILTAVGIVAATSAQAQTAKIVGLGAANCALFNQEVRDAPAIQRDYFAWAQGFMSGALIRAPQGIDENLDLSPPSFPLQAQAEFLRAFCEKHPDQDYMDAARALYHQLRDPGS